MSTAGWVVLVVVLVLLAAALWYFTQQRRRKHLSGRFGPEYQRTVQAAGSRAEAEKVLAQREERVAALQIRELTPDERRRYAGEWQRAQARFVDQPGAAVAESDRLISDVMQLRGYPVGDFERRAEDLSVEHPVVVQHYRAGHELAERSRAGRASTEDLRQAMVHYRALFKDLLEETPRPEAMEKPAQRGRGSKIKEVKYDRPK